MTLTYEPRELRLNYTFKMLLAIVLFGLQFLDEFLCLPLYFVGKTNRISVLPFSRL